MICQHDFKILLGKDHTNSERYCVLCGKIEIYSGITKSWIHMGFLKDLDESLNDV